MSAATDFIVIRHGETDWNRELRFQGHADVPLNDAGHAQAARLAQRLRHEPRADAFYSSDLQRARQTAAPLAEAWAVTPRLQAALREQSFGVAEGLDAAAIQARHPELWQRWLEHRADYVIPGGESTRQFHARVLGAVRALAEQHPGQRLTLTTHGGVLDMLWRTVHGLALNGARDCAIPNTGINHLRWRAGTLQIITWGDDAHVRLP